MKKRMRRVTALALSWILMLSMGIQALAAWPATGNTQADNYLNNIGTIYMGNTAFSDSMYRLSHFMNVYLFPEGTDTSEFRAAPTSIDFGSLQGSKDNTASLVMGQTYDFSKPVQYDVTASDGRTFPVFAMAAEGIGGWDGWTEQDTEDLLAMTDLIANTFVQIAAKINQISSAEAKVGSYHPANAGMLETLGYWLGINTAYYTDSDSGMNGNRMFDSYMNIWNAGGSEAVEFTREYLEKYVEQKNTTGGSYQIKPETLRVIYEEIVPFYLDYAENMRIPEPALGSFILGGSTGIIDEENKTITVKLPAGTDLTAVGAPVVEAKGWNKAVQIAGSVTSGTMAYQLTPYDLAYGTEYTELSGSWIVYIEEGTPEHRITSFSVTIDDVTRYAKIDEETKTITLNLPEGTDLTVIAPTITHTGTNTTMDSGTFDFTNSKTTPLSLTLTNSYFPELSAEYQVTVTAEKSAENAILSYEIGEATGTVDKSGHKVEITIPYAEDLSLVTPKIEVSEFASLTEPDALQVGDNTYLVKAENGAEQSWTVVIKREAVATGNQILSFSYGSAKGTVDQVKGTVTLELPAGTPTTFAPAIEVSPYATVSPASGVSQDFSKPVNYTVTAQNGATNTYTVTVTVSTEAVENPYIDDMQSLVNKIINRYHSEAADDWEWMNLGFYQDKADNLDDGYSIADCIAKLDVTTNVAMTNIDRKIMTLTARGIDCTNLARYNNGEPFLDKAGNEVDNLVEILYNYSGGWTINGPTFALIALDMGTYTIPENALWTREVLLETLLDHVYLSDGFGLDMVTMMMQAMAPYYNDPVYGARVQAKLEEGFEIVQDYFGDGNDYNNPYGVQWGGVYTSEGSAQVICALSAMGVDCYSDVRLNDGTHSALSAFLDYANYEDGYFHHATGVLNNAMATYQGCYASQWYLGFIENGGAGHPYSLYYQRFDFSRKLSTDASITAFTLDGKSGTITEAGEGGKNTITVTLPESTDLTAMYPRVTLAEGATLLAPDLGQPVTFIEGVEQPFTVQAEDGKTLKTYYVTVSCSADVLASGAELIASTIELEDANILRTLDILEQKVKTASDGATEIELSVNAGVDTKNLYLTADISSGAACTPAVDKSAKVDLTDWTTYTVVSQDKTNTGIYRIKVTPVKQAAIAAFQLTIGGKAYSGVIDNDKNTITVSGVDDSTLTTTSFAPDITFAEGTTVCSPTSGVAQDFSKQVTYIVSGANVAARTYTVSVYNTEGKLITSTSSGSDTPVVEATGAKITGFSIYGVDGEIDQTNGTIVVTLPYGTNVTAAAPVVKTTSGCTVSPVSGEVVNLTAPVVYTVMLGTESKQYTVRVVYERSISQQLWDEVSEDENNSVTDHQVSKDPHGLKGGWKP